MTRKMETAEEIRSDENSLIGGIGKKIRDIRKAKNLFASEIARRANVSNGLISRIENGRTIPSLPVLFALIQALEVDAADFFEGITRDSLSGYLHFKPSDFQTLEKEAEAVGFEYTLICTRQLSFIGVEFNILKLHPNCKRDRVETDAFEFKYMLSGKCTYQIGDDTIDLRQGEALFFDGRISHVPLNPGSEPAVMLVCYLYTSQDN